MSLVNVAFDVLASGKVRAEVEGGGMGSGSGHDGKTAQELSTVLQSCEDLDVLVEWVLRRRRKKDAA